MMTVKLVETTWFIRYPWPIEITYYQECEFFSHEFKITPIYNECWIKTKLATFVNTQDNSVIEIIHQVSGNFSFMYNLQETYVYYYDPWMGVLMKNLLRKTIHSMILKIKPWDI